MLTNKKNIMKIFVLVFILVILTLFTYNSPNTFATTDCSTGPQSIKVDKGFLTSANPTPVANNFLTPIPGINANLCLTDKRASIPQFSVPTYQEMLAAYYTQNKSIPATSKKPLSGDKDQSSISLAANEKEIYHIQKSATENGNLTLNSDISVVSPSIGVIFIDGDLFINTEIVSASQINSGIVFVVQGAVNIAPSVTDINAFIITFGGFCSVYNSGCITSDANKLTIYGSIISLSTDPTKQPQFVRNNSSGNANPAEEIIYQPKYLVILRDIFAKDLTIWSEVQ